MIMMRNRLVKYFSMNNAWEKKELRKNEWVNNFKLWAHMRRSLAVKMTILPTILHVVEF